MSVKITCEEKEEKALFGKDAYVAKGRKKGEKEKRRGQEEERKGVIR